MARTHMMVFQIYSICSMMETGKIVVPAFQRGFVWSKSHAKNLLESIYHGYPIGTIIVLETDDLGILEVEKSLFPSIPEEKLHRWYVLDGVQRLATLYNVLFAKNGKLSFFFDLDNEEFFVSPKAIEGPGHIDLHALYASAEFLEIQKQIGESEKYELYFTRFSKLYDAFKNYLVPMHVISDVLLTDAMSIFERLNVGGQRLSKSDIEKIRKMKK